MNLSDWIKNNLYLFIIIILLVFMIIFVLGYKFNKSLTSTYTPINKPNRLNVYETKELDMDDDNKYGIYGGRKSIIRKLKRKYKK